MIDLNAFRDTLDLYRKHGWELARLLSQEAPNQDLSVIIGGTPVREFPIEAAWFTRSSQPSMTTWELRHLGPSPLAVVSVVSDDLDLEEELAFQEAKLLEMLSRKTTPPDRKNGTS